MCAAPVAVPAAESAREQAKDMNAKSKACAVIFDQFDSDQNGFLDEREVSMFTERIGLKLSKEELDIVIVSCVCLLQNSCPVYFKTPRLVHIGSSWRQTCC